MQAESVYLPIKETAMVINKKATMKKYYSKPTTESIRLHPGILLAVSDGITVTISGYQPSGDDNDGFSQVSVLESH